jgi:Membrane transport protein
MFLQILTIIVPIFFVLLLGYAAGRAKEFDSDQVAGINELVLDFALPASLFVGTVSTPRDQLLQQGPLVLALLIGIVGLYVIVLLLGRQLFRHAMGVAALQAITVCFSAGPYFGPAVLTPVYGASSAVAISMIAIILNIVIVPMTLVLIEISRGTESSAAKSSIASLVGPALVNAVKAPFVWAPLLAVALVFVGVSVPPLVDSALSLIGSSHWRRCFVCRRAHDRCPQGYLQSGSRRKYGTQDARAAGCLLSAGAGIRCQAAVPVRGLASDGVAVRPHGYSARDKEQNVRVGCILGPCGHLHRNADHASHRLVPDWSRAMI